MNKKETLLCHVQKFTLKYFTYYNCYQSQPILPFYKGCKEIKDRFTIYMKTQLQMNFVILKETDLYKSNSVGNWTENLINLNGFSIIFSLVLYKTHFLN